MSTPEPVANPLAEDLEHVLAQTRILWEGARNRSIFVTGGTGFFGRWLLETFAHANSSLDLQARVVVLSRDPATFSRKAPHLFANEAIQFVTGDVQTFSAALVHPVLEGKVAKFDFVIHAATAASAQLNLEDPLLMADTIVSGTRAALDFAVASGARRFLLTSSGAVYGPQPVEMTHVPEDYLGGPDCTTPDSAYAEGKRMSELLCACYQKQHAIEPLIARCFAFVGPFLPLDTHFAIGNFIGDALRGGPIRIEGDGTPYRSYLYAADLAIWLWTLLFRGEPGRAYNVGSAAEYSIRSVAENVREAIGGASGIEQAEVPPANRRPSRYVPATDRARHELQLREWISLDEAIRRTGAAAETRAGDDSCSHT